MIRLHILNKISVHTHTNTNTHTNTHKNTDSHIHLHTAGVDPCVCVCVCVYKNAVQKNAIHSFIRLRAIKYSTTGKRLKWDPPQSRGLADSQERGREWVIRAG